MNVMLVLRPFVLARRVDVVRVDHEPADITDFLRRPFVAGADAIALAFERREDQRPSKEIVGKGIGRAVQAHRDARGGNDRFTSTATAPGVDRAFLTLRTGGKMS
jgi:hypothetical protein